MWLFFPFLLVPPDPCIYIYIYMQFQGLQTVHFQSGLMSGSAVTVSKVDGAKQMQPADGVE